MPSHSVLAVKDIENFVGRHFFSDAKLNEIDCFCALPKLPSAVGKAGSEITSTASLGYRLPVKGAEPAAAPLPVQVKVDASYRSPVYPLEAYVLLSSSAPYVSNASLSCTTGAVTLNRDLTHRLLIESGTSTITYQLSDAHIQATVKANVKDRLNSVIEFSGQVTRHLHAGMSMDYDSNRSGVKRLSMSAAVDHEHRFLRGGDAACRYDWKTGYHVDFRIPLNAGSSQNQHSHRSHALVRASSRQLTCGLSFEPLATRMKKVVCWAALAKQQLSASMMVSCSIFNHWEVQVLAQQPISAKPQPPQIGLHFTHTA